MWPRKGDDMAVEPVLVNKTTGRWEHNIYRCADGGWETRVENPPDDPLGFFHKLSGWETLEEVKLWACELNGIDPDEYDLMDYFTGEVYC